MVMAAARGISPLGAASRSGRRCAFLRRRQFDSGPTGFGQPDGNGLFGGAGSVFAAADVMYFFAHEFSGLRRSGLPLGLVPVRSPDCCGFRHDVLSFQFWLMVISWLPRPRAVPFSKVNLDLPIDHGRMALAR
jgi:hypothetical protein